MRFGLPDDVLPRLVEVLASNDNVKRITLYGSRAKGNQRTGSDIDLCLDADALSLGELLKLETDIDDLLLPWKVDISVRQQIENSELTAHIDRVGVQLYPLALSDKVNQPRDVI